MNFRLFVVHVLSCLQFWKINNCVKHEFPIGNNSLLLLLYSVGKVLVNFTADSCTPALDQERLYDVSIPSGGSLCKELLVLGAPPPSSLVLERYNSASGLYERFHRDPQVVLNNETLSIPNLRLSDSGAFRIVATNSEGDSYREFNLEVTGECRKWYGVHVTITCCYT